MFLKPLKMFFQEPYKRLGLSLHNSSRSRGSKDLSSILANILVLLPMKWLTKIFLVRTRNQSTANSLTNNYTTMTYLGGAAVWRRTGDQKVAGSTPGRGAIKSTRLIQPSIPPG